MPLASDDFDRSLSIWPLIFWVQTYIVLFHNYTYYFKKCYLCLGNQRGLPLSFSRVVMIVNIIKLYKYSYFKSWIGKFSLTVITKTVFSCQRCVEKGNIYMTSQNLTMTGNSTKVFLFVITKMMIYVIIVVIQMSISYSKELQINISLFECGVDRFWGGSLKQHLVIVKGWIYIFWKKLYKSWNKNNKIVLSYSYGLFLLGCSSKTAERL